MMNPTHQCCERHLPEGLWPEILSRLPVKSLLRFRSVSHPWLELIDYPAFARLHLAHYNHNRLETHLLVARDSNSEYAFRCASTLLLTSKRRFSEPGVPSMENGRFISSIDGMFMIKGDSPSKRGGYRHMLWNPSVRKTRILPRSPKIPNQMETLDFGLGFDPLTKDYKHVRLVLTRARAPQSVAVYSVGTNSWKTIAFQADDDGCSTRCRQRFYVDDDEPANFCLRGFLFILATIGDSVAQELVSFGLSTEVFASTQLPLEGDDSTYTLSLSMADSGSSLAVIYFSNIGAGSIWVLEGLGAHTKSLSWSKRTTFASMIPEFDARAGSCTFFYLRKNDEMLLKWNKMVTSYNLQTHKEKIVMWAHLEYCGTQATPYIESLVLALVD